MGFLFQAAVSRNIEIGEETMRFTRYAWPAIFAAVDASAGGLSALSGLLDADSSTTNRPAGAGRFSGCLSQRRR